MVDVLTGKLLIGVAAAAATLLALRVRALSEMPDRSFTYAAIALLLVNRLGLFFVVLILMGAEPASDVTVYVDEARKVLHGQIPFRDFFTAYSPLFPFVAAIPLPLWNSAKAVILEGLVLEALSLPLWLAFARRAFAEQTVRRATVIYCFNPFAQLIIPLAGQNHVWLSFFLAASLWLAPMRGRTSREGISGFVFSMGTVMVKWLALLYAPILLMRSQRRTLWLTAMLLPILTLYGFWTAYCGPGALLGNIEFHALHASSGNLPYLLTALGADFASARYLELMNVVGLAVLGAVFLLSTLRLPRFDDRVTTFMLVVITLTFLIVSKKAFTSYFVITLFPFCLLLARPGQSMLATVVSLGFLVMAGIEPSLWFRWLHEGGLGGMFDYRSGEPSVHLVFFFAVETILLCSYAYYAAAAFRAAVGAAAADDAVPQNGSHSRDVCDLSPAVVVGAAVQQPR